MLHEVFLAHQRCSLQIPQGRRQTKNGAQQLPLLRSMRKSLSASKSSTCLIHSNMLPYNTEWEHRKSDERSSPVLLQPSWRTARRIGYFALPVSRPKGDQRTSISAERENRLKTYSHSHTEPSHVLRRFARENLLQAQWVYIRPWGCRQLGSH